MARRKIYYHTFNLLDILDKISKFEIKHIGLIVTTYFNNIVISSIEVSERYWSFDFKSFARDVVNSICNYFTPELYSFRINKGSQEIRLTGEKVIIGDDVYYKMFNIVNSSDKSRALKINIGLIKESTSSPIVISVNNESASVSGKHFAKSLPDRLKEFYDVLPNFNIIINNQIETIKSLKLKYTTLKQIVSNFLKKDEDGILVASDLMKMKMFFKKLDSVNYYFTDEEKLIISKYKDHPEKLVEHEFDVIVNCGLALDLYVEIFKNYDSSTIERETKVITNVIFTCVDA